MRSLKAFYNWLRDRKRIIGCRYQSLGCLYFVFWWLVFFAVLILFTGGWYDELVIECKNESFNGFTMMMVFVSGVAAFVKASDKIKGKQEKN